MRPLLLLLLLLVSTLVQAQPGIMKSDYEALLASQRKDDGKTVSVRVDEWGNSTALAVHAQEVLLVPCIENRRLTICGRRVILSSDTVTWLRVIDPEKDTALAQLHTALRLAKLMKEKKFEEARTLFSTRQRQAMAGGPGGEEGKQFWNAAWTFDLSKLQRYAGKILRGRVPFVFEEGLRRIDEH